MPLIFLTVIDTQSSLLTSSIFLEIYSCHCCLQKLIVAALDLSDFVTTLLRCKMWAAFCYGNCMPYPFGNCAAFAFGNFNSMASFNCMGFPPANMFPVPWVPACNPYAMAPGNFVPFPSVPPCNFNAGHYQNYKVYPPEPPCSFDAGHYQNFKGDHPRYLNASPARKVRSVSPVPPSNFNDGHPRNYKDCPRSRPRDVNAAFQRSSRPSVSEFSENPKQYQGFVLVMVISTGKMEVLNWREASEKGKQVKIVSTQSESRSYSTSPFRHY